MLHVRVVAAPEVTPSLVAGVKALPGVCNLLVLEQADSQRPGDAILFDAHGDAANEAFQIVRGLGLDVDDATIVQRIDASLTQRPPAGRGIGALAPEAVPVWEMVDASIRAGAAYSPSFFILLAIAGLIGAVGIFTNSQILIVGAMVVGPEYSAIIAVALGMSKREPRPVRDGLFALSTGFAAAILITFVFALVVRATGGTPHAYLSGIRPVSDLIDNPNWFSVVVAILAGTVGVVSLTESRAGALTGVFISVTTIPAAADTGVSLAFGSWDEARGSFLQLLLNVVLLIAVGAAGLVAQRAMWRRLARRHTRLAEPQPAPHSS